MRSYILAISLFYSLFSLNSIAQEQEIVKEVVKVNGEKKNVTLTSSGMYDGTESEEAWRYFNKGTDYEKEGDFENAILSYKKAIKADPSFVEAYDNLGISYRRVGDFKNAIKYYKKSIEIYPDGSMAHQNLAAVYGYLNENEKALKEYKEVLRISDVNPEGYFGLARSYAALKDYDKALENATEALKIYEATNSHHLGDGYTLISVIYFQKDDKENAQIYLQKAKDIGAKVDPDLENLIMGKNSEEEIIMETDEDYEKYEEQVMKARNWLLNTPVDVKEDQRKAISSFILQWATGTPKVTLELYSGLIDYEECPECLVMFISGWSNFALKSGKYDNAYLGTMAGVKDVMKFYKKNKKSLGRNKSIEKLIRLDESGKLKEYIKSQIVNQ